MPAAELVPGDVIQIRAGNKVPADVRIAEASSDLKFNRSILTGESNAASASLNNTSDNFLEVRIDGPFNANNLDQKYCNAGNALHLWVWHWNCCPHWRPHRLRQDCHGLLQTERGHDHVTNGNPSLCPRGHFCSRGRFHSCDYRLGNLASCPTSWLPQCLRSHRLRCLCQRCFHSRR
jgi:hypothetical protein